MTNVMFLRDAAWDTAQRHALECGYGTGKKRRIGSQILADDAHDRHIGFGIHLGKMLEVVDDVLEAARVVDRHRYTHLW